MIIDVRSKRVVYITIGKWEYYIDDSTGEQIVSKRDITEPLNPGFDAVWERVEQ